MAEESPSSGTKHHIESLSNLIFGLALSIGALTLIGQLPSTFEQFIYALAFYAFSFLILIGVWNSYMHTMSVLRIETPGLMNLNILLLFLVSIEPFIFNQMLHSSMDLVENISIVYALDLGGLFLILASFSNSISREKKTDEQLSRRYRLRRNIQLIGAALFLVSALPIFWYEVVFANGINLIVIPRFVFWLVPLLLPTIRHLLEREAKQPTIKSHA
jgi:uncharacterized membrane protein